MSNATITANDSASSTIANTTARRGLIRPAATGRDAVRGPISRSISRSITWFSALAPPHASPPPITSAVSAPSDGAPPAAATIAHTAVNTSSDMIRGLVSVT